MRTTSLERKRRDRAVVLWGLVFFALAQATAYGFLQFMPRAERFTLTRSATQRTPDICESIVHWQSHHVLTTDEAEELVFLGDSTCLMGVIPATIELKANVRTRNLGTLAYLSSAGHAEMLQLFIDRHGPPKFLVYYVCPITLSVSDREIERIGYLQRFREHVGAGPLPIIPRQPRTWLPSCHLSSRLLTMAEAGLASETTFEAQRGPLPSDREIRLQLEKSKGYLIDPTDPSKKLLAPVALDVELSNDFTAGLVRILAIAESYHFKLAIMMNPVSENYATAETAAAFEGLEARLQDLAGPCSQVMVASPALRYAPASSFGTTHHLTQAGARANSEEIATWLAQTWPASRSSSDSICGSAKLRSDAIRSR